MRIEPPFVVLPAPAGGDAIRLRAVRQQTAAARAGQQRIETHGRGIVPQLDVQRPRGHADAVARQQLHAQQVVQCSTIHAAGAGEILGHCVHRIRRPALFDRLLQGGELITQLLLGGGPGAGHQLQQQGQQQA